MMTCEKPYRVMWGIFIYKVGRMINLLTVVVNLWNILHQNRPHSTILGSMIYEFLTIMWYGIRNSIIKYTLQLEITYINKETMKQNNVILCGMLV